VLAGARSTAAIAEWAADTPQPIRAALGARRDAPDHVAVPAEATIRRTLARLDADALAGAIGVWLADRERERPGPAASRRRAVAVDGKTLRGARTGTANGDGRPVHLLAAMDHTTRAVLAQRQAGYSVYFTTLDDLVRNLKDAQDGVFAYPLVRNLVRTELLDAGYYRSSQRFRVQPDCERIATLDQARAATVRWWEQRQAAEPRLCAALVAVCKRASIPLSEGGGGG
jgi:DDE_Tnp_1-associated